MRIQLRRSFPVSWIAPVWTAEKVFSKVKLISFNHKYDDLMHLGLIRTINIQLSKDVNIIFVKPIKLKLFLRRKWTLYRFNNRESEGLLKTKSF